MTYVIFLAIAAVLLVCPWILTRIIDIVGHGDLPIHAAPKPSGPSFENAISDVAIVQKRLRDTKQLDDKAKAAIETLVQALVAGSDQ
jgi:hypothetical protein